MASIPRRSRDWFPCESFYPEVRSPPPPCAAPSGLLVQVEQGIVYFGEVLEASHGRGRVLGPVHIESLLHRYLDAVDLLIVGIERLLDDRVSLISLPLARSKERVTSLDGSFTVTTTTCAFFPSTSASGPGGWDWSKSVPIRVMLRDGQWVSYGYRLWNRTRCTALRRLGTSVPDSVPASVKREGRRAGPQSGPSRPARDRAT